MSSGGVRTIWRGFFSGPTLRVEPLSLEYWHILFSSFSVLCFSPTSGFRNLVSRTCDIVLCEKLHDVQPWGETSQKSSRWLVCHICLVVGFGSTRSETNKLTQIPLILIGASQQVLRTCDSLKNTRKSAFVKKKVKLPKEWFIFYIFLLVGSKYEGP